MFPMNIDSRMAIALASILSLTNGKDHDSQPARLVPCFLKPKYSAGRNEKCPCNSGKKFKNCCINEKVEIKKEENEPATVL